MSQASRDRHKNDEVLARMDRKQHPELYMLLASICGQNVRVFFWAVSLNSEIADSHLRFGLACHKLENFGHHALYEVAV
eukprot:scaffold540684_cov18-Prasinocladus_malaysianus.AAC.1